MNTEELDLSIKENRKKIASKFIDALSELSEFNGSYTYNEKTITVSSKIYTWLDEELEDSEFIRIAMNKFIELYKELVKFGKGKKVKSKDEASTDILLLNFNDVSADDYKGTFKSEKDKRYGIVTHEIVFKNVKNIGKIRVKYEIKENDSKMKKEADVIYKNIIREIKDKVLNYEDREFLLIDKEIKIKFDFPETAFFNFHVQNGKMTGKYPFYFDRDVVLPIYRSILKNGNLNGEYKIPMYNQNPFADLYTLKEDIPFDKYPLIKIEKGVPYLKEGNVIRPLKYEVTKREKKTAGFLIVSIKDIEELDYAVKLKSGTHIINK